MDKAAALPAYRPPMAVSGVPDGKKGWDYLEHGNDWASVSAACAAKTGQSPIDIEKFVDIEGQSKTVLWFDYFADHEVQDAHNIVNDGHGLMFHDSSVDLGFVKLGLDEFKAAEYTFHTPSEHTIDGQVFPLEIQVVHNLQNKKLAVSLLFKYGPSNEFLASLMKTEMPVWKVTNKGASLAELLGNETDAFNLEHVLPLEGTHPGSQMTFYNYEGSLTAPPCDGGVDWWVSSNPLEATKAEIEHIKQAIFASASSAHGNNRYTQSLGQRKVRVGHTGVQHHFANHGHLTKVHAAPRGYSSQDTPWTSEAAPEA